MEGSDLTMEGVFRLWRGTVEGSGPTMERDYGGE